MIVLIRKEGTQTLKESQMAGRKRLKKWVYNPRGRKNCLQEKRKEIGVKHILPNSFPRAWSCRQPHFKNCVFLLLDVSLWKNFLKEITWSTIPMFYSMYFLVFNLTCKYLSELTAWVRCYELVSFFMKLPYSCNINMKILLSPLYSVGSFIINLWLTGWESVFLVLSSTPLIKGVCICSGTKLDPYYCSKLRSVMPPFLFFWFVLF